MISMGFNESRNIMKPNENDIKYKEENEAYMGKMQQMKSWLAAQ